MGLTLYLYVSMLCFIGISAYKARKFAQMPLHGRLELYPVPKEKGHEHGGSYYEEVEWWKKPREVSVITEIKEMLKEMLFIKKLFENQRPLWWISYSLHLGIYLLAGWTVLLVLGATAELSGLAVNSAAAKDSLWVSFLFYLTSIVGFVGLILAVLGSGALFLRRAFDGTLKKYTTPQEYLNVLLLLVVTLSGLMAWSSDLSFGNARGLMESLLTFAPVEAGAGLSVHLFLLGIMFIYIPMSKMSHYIGKYFTFHKVMWENDPNVIGSEVEKKVKAAASYKPQNSWAAPHVKGTVATSKDQ